MDNKDEIKRLVTFSIQGPWKKVDAETVLMEAWKPHNSDDVRIWIEEEQTIAGEGPDMKIQVNKGTLPAPVRQEIANAEAQNFTLVDMDVETFPFSQKYLLTFVSCGRGDLMEAYIATLEYYPENENVVGYEHLRLYVNELMNVAVLAKNEAILADRKGA